jgi:hypothetical protein
MDIETGYGHGPDNSPALFAWAKANPEKFAQIQARHHMVNLSKSDWGHFEFSPAGRGTGPAGGATTGSPGATGGGWNSTRGSWYSQAPGWHDSGDKPGSNALHVPDSQQGIALPNAKTLGQSFDVKWPDGSVTTERQTDIGPGPGGHGRGIDISAAAAARHGMKGPGQFPTDKGFSYRPHSEAAWGKTSGAGAPSTKHEPADSPHVAGAQHMESADPRTPHPGAASVKGPDMKNLMDEHREYRKEVEKPISVNFRTPNRGHARQMFNRQQTRWNQHSQRPAHHASPTDIGIG